MPALSNRARARARARARIRLALIAAAFSSLLLFAAPAPAEIERIAEPGESRMLFLWWPKVTPPAGWVHLREVSVENHINMFVPKGQSFADAPVVMYARAIYFE